MAARGATGLLLASGLLAAGLAGARLVHDLPTGTALALSHPTGTWATLAIDLADDGVLYRPLSSPLGYGGTRYFPLHVVLHAGLMRAGLGPAASGHIISLAAALAIVSGLFLLLRRSGVPPLEALAGCLLSLAFQPMQEALAQVRGDLLPAALNLWGLVLCLPRSGRPSRVIGPALLFALAFVAKVTTVFGIAAAATVAVLAGDRRRAGRLVIVVAAVAGALLGATLLWSHGRLLESMAAVASGGASLPRVLGAPVALLARSDASDIVLIVLGVAAAANATRRRELLPISLLVTFAVTLVLFGSPGVDSNHLVDLEILAIALVVIETTRALPRWFGAVALALATTLTVPATLDWLDVPATDRTVAKVVEEAGAEKGPLLAENPWIAIVAGERPFLLDAFNLRVVARRHPEVAADLAARLDEGYFRAVVLVMPVGSGDTLAGRWYERLQFGPGFAEHLARGYHLVASHPVRGQWGFYVWRRNRAPSLR